MAALGVAPLQGDQLHRQQAALQQPRLVRQRGLLELRELLELLELLTLPSCLLRHQEMHLLLVLAG
jgi:hypothetical protein